MSHDPIKKYTSVRDRVLNNNFKDMDSDETHILRDMVYSYNLFDHGNEMAGVTMSEAFETEKKYKEKFWEELELNKDTPMDDGSIRKFEYEDPVSFVESIPDGKKEDFNLLVDELVRRAMSNTHKSQKSEIKHMKLGGVVDESSKGDPISDKVNSLLKEAGLPAMSEEKLNELSSFYEGDESKILSDVQSGISQYAEKNTPQKTTEPTPTPPPPPSTAVPGEDLSKREEVEVDEFKSKFDKIKAIKKSGRSIKEVEKKLQRYQDYFQYEYGDNWIKNPKAREDSKMAEYASIVPQFKQDVKNIEALSNELREEMVDRQVEIDKRDEFQNSKPELMLPSWQDRRARGLYSWMTNSLVEDPLSLISLASRKVGLESLANNIDDNVSAIRGARESELAMPTRMQGGLYKDYVMHDDTKVFVDEEGNFINAVDPETGVVTPKSQADIDAFNSIGGKDVKRDTSGYRMLSNLEHSAYDLAALLGGGLAVAKGVAKSGAKRATKRKLASGYTAGAVIYQSYSDNYADMMDKLQDPDAASTAAFTKSVLSGMVENVAGLDKLPMNMKMGLTNVLNDVSIRYAMGKITRGQVAKEFIKHATKQNLGEVAEELMDAQKDKLIDYAYGVQSDPMLNMDEITETGLSTMALMIPLAGAAGWNHASPHNLQGNSFYHAAKDPQKFIDVASEAVSNGDITQDEADARVDIVNKISNDLPYMDDMSEDDKAMYAKLKAQELTLDKIIQGNSVSDPIRKKVTSRLTDIRKAMEDVVEGRISANPPALPSPVEGGRKEESVPRHEKDKSFLNEMGIENIEEIGDHQYSGYFENESDIPSDIRELGTFVLRTDSGGEYFDFDIMGSDLRDAYNVKNPTTDEIDIKEEVKDSIEEGEFVVPEGYRVVSAGEQVESDHAVIRDFQGSGQDITTAPIPPSPQQVNPNITEYKLEKKMPVPGDKVELFGKTHIVSSLEDGVLKARAEGSESLMKIKDFKPTMSDFGGVITEVAPTSPVEVEPKEVRSVPISGPAPMPITPVPQTSVEEDGAKAVVRSGVSVPVKKNEDGEWSKMVAEDPAYADMQKKSAKQIKSPTSTNVDRSNDRELHSQNIGGYDVRLVDRYGDTVAQHKLDDEWTDLPSDHPIKELLIDSNNQEAPLSISDNAREELREVNPLRSGEGDDITELGKILKADKLKPSSKVSEKIANRDKSAKGDKIGRERDLRRYRDRVKSKSGKKLLDTMIKAFPVAESLGLTPVLHESIDSFANAIADSGNDPGIAGSSNGFFRTDTNEIHIPLYGRVKENVFLHEVIHPILAIAASKNPNLIQELSSQLLSDPDLKSKFFDNFGNKFYDGDQARVEALVEFLADRAFAQMVNNDGSKSLVKKFIDYFQELLKSVGVDPSLISTKKDLFEFADGLAQVLSNGVPLVDGDSVSPVKTTNIYQSRKAPLTKKEALNQITEKSAELNSLGYSPETIVSFYESNGVNLNVKEVADALSKNKSAKPDENRVLESVRVFHDRGWSSSKTFEALKDLIPGLNMSDVLKAKGKIKSDALSKEYNTPEMKELEVDYRKAKLEEIYGIPKGINPTFSQDDINKQIVDRRLDEPDVAVGIADGVINMRQDDPTNIRVGLAEDAGMAIAMDKIQDRLSDLENQINSPGVDPTHKEELIEMRAKLLASYWKIGSALQISRSATGRQLASYKSSKYRLDEHKVILEMSDLARSRGETLTDDDIATIRRMFQERDELEKAVNATNMNSIKDTIKKVDSLAIVEFNAIKGGKEEDIDRVISKIKSLFSSAQNRDKLQHSMGTTFDGDSSGKVYDLNTYRTLLLELIKGVKAKKDVNTLGGVINYIVKTEPRIKSQDIVEALVFHANKDALIKDYQQRIKQLHLTKKEHSALSDMILKTSGKKPSKKNLARIFDGLGRFRNRSFLSNMLVSEIGEVNTAIDDILHLYNEVHFVKPHGIDVEATMERIASGLDLISKNFKLDKIDESTSQWMGMIEDIKNGDYSRVDQLTNPIDQTLIKDKTRKINKSLNDKNLEISEFAKSRYKKWYSKLGSIPDLMRSIRLSVDASATLVQGAKVTVRMLATNPSKVYENIYSSLTAMGGEVFNNDYKGFAEQQFQDIINHPFQEKREKADLKISRPGGGYESGEEYFTSDLARRIPLLGRLISGSDAAMTVYLNAIRVGQFDSYLQKNPMASEEELAVVAAHINTSTGVTNFGSAKERKDLEGTLRVESFQRAFMGGLPALNFAFIATRLYASNFMYILNTPWQVMKAITTGVNSDPSHNAYMYALKDKAITLGMFTGIYAATKSIFEAMGYPCSISYNPRSSAFMKLHCGERTMAITGGAESYVRLLAQMMVKGSEGYDQQEVDNSIDSQYFNMENSKSLAFSFFQHKITPFNGFVFNVISDTDFIGRPLPEGWDKVAYYVRNILPISVQNFWEEMSVADALTPGVTVTSFFGGQIMHYDNASKHNLAIDHMKKVNYKPAVGSQMQSEDFDFIKASDYLKFQFKEDVKDKWGNWLVQSLERGVDPDRKEMLEVMKEITQQTLYEYQRENL